MSLVNQNILGGAAAQGDYTIERSLRLRSSASAYLSRTPASAGNRKTWSWSGWVKRGSLGTPAKTIFSAGTNGSSARGIIDFNDTNTLRFGFNDGSTWYIAETTAVFRDPSAWYHIVVKCDLSNATQSSRAALYVNGVQQTTNSVAWPNADQVFNNTVFHGIGRNYGDGTQYLDGYLTEVNFIDGQALTPSDFGNYNEDTGVWQPAKYAGSYGTNGFYLPFSDNTTTTTLAADASGNGNDWTPNNISLTSGVTYDSMTDTPTPYADGGNYAVLNPLTIGTSNTNILDGNLNAAAASSGSGSNWGAAFSSIAIPTSGKWYAEGQAYINAGVGNNSVLGVVDSASFVPAHNAILYAYTTGEGFDGIYISLFNNNAQPVSDGVLGTAVGSLTGTTVDVMLAVDVDAGKVWAGYDGTWLNSGDPVAGTGQVALRTFSPTDVVAVGTAFSDNAQGMKANFGQRPFAYTPPTGFLPLHTGNLPDSAIVDGSEYFDAVTWTGNGASRSITGLNFQPDFVWPKSRSAAIGHLQFDAVRGATKYLQSASTSAEGTGSDSLTAFNANGFSLGADTSTTGVNQNGTTYVAWNWKANGAGVSNTDGSITSTVSANPTSGFSIVSFTTNNTAGATVGHGLGDIPAMIIVKYRNLTGTNWVVYHKNMSATPQNNYLNLNVTSGIGTSSDPWNNTAPTSDVITLGAGVGSASSTNYGTFTSVAYCFAEVPGFSKFGSYTGNGSTDGPFVFLGFRPKFLLIKKTSATDNWVVIDTTRDNDNLVTQRLLPNLSDAESTADMGDILSNGYKIRTSGGLTNTSGATFIYMAFAEHPFANALAR